MYIALNIFMPVAISVRFDNAVYVVDEDSGMVQPLLYLSNPSSFVETIQLINADVTSNGMYKYIALLAMYIV